jgi:ribosomal protein S18 acetylase RimI-like enzyme
VAVVSAPLSRQACRLHSIEFAAGTLPLQKDKITIRDAESNDAPELAVLMRELGYETKQAEMESRLKLILSNPAYKTFVAIMDGRVCGMIGTLTYTSYEHYNQSGRILALVTLSEARQRGIGRALIATAEKDFAQRRIRRVALDTRLTERTHTNFTSRSVTSETGGDL